MATFSSSPKHSQSHRYGIRSISLPSRSHPSTIRIEEELNKLKSSWEASSSSSKVETICFGLFGLVELYKCVEDLLKLSSLTQQALFLHQNEKWVDELLDCPVRFLDILGETRENIMLMKGNFQELQSALRRRRFEELVIEKHVSSYWCLRRSMRKSCTKSLLLLKQIDGSFGGTYFPPLELELNNNNHHLCSVVRVLREASLITSSIFQSLVDFLASQIFNKAKVNNNKWAFVSRLLMRKGKGIHEVEGNNNNINNQEEENVNELEKVDLALCRMVIDDNSCKDFEADQKVQFVQREIEGVVVVIEALENGLDCLFKHLINTRVSFLNILSP